MLNDERVEVVSDFRAAGVLVDRDAPAHPAPLYRQDFLEPIAEKLYEARMAGYTPTAGGAAPMGAPMPWEQLTEGTRELWRNVASVAVLHIAERTPPTLDLTPAEVEALDQGINAALTIGMLMPRLSATDRDTTAKTLRYIADQRDRFTNAAALGEQLTFAPAPSYPEMVAAEFGREPERLTPEEYSSLVYELEDDKELLAKVVRLLGGAVPTPKEKTRIPAILEVARPPAREEPKSVEQLRESGQCANEVWGSGAGPGEFNRFQGHCIRRAGHCGAPIEGGQCTVDPTRARELDLRDFKAAR